MTDLEDLIRATLREHADPVRSPPHLPAGARRRAARAHRLRTWTLAAGVAVAAVIAAASWSPWPDLTGRTGDVRPQSAPALAVPSGWRPVSSLGIEFMVPAGWIDDDWGCPKPGPGNVMRGGGFAALTARCVYRAAEHSSVPVVRVAALGSGPADTELSLQRLGVTLPPGRAANVAGLAAEKGEGRTPDNRFTGWIKIPSRHVLLTVQTSDTSTGQRILASIRTVDIDFNGCPTRRAAIAPPRPSTPQPVPADVVSISACYYGEYQRDAPTARLIASAHLQRADASQAATAINAHPSPAPPAPGCRMEEPQSPDIALLFQRPDGTAQTVITTSNTCTGLGLSNGRDTMTIPRPLAKRLLSPLHAAYGPDPELTG